MGQKQKALETIWQVPDKLWEKLKPIFDEYDPHDWLFPRMACAVQHHGGAGTTAATF